MTDAHALPIGTQLKDYRIEDILGAGGFGITYRACDIRLETIVALKEYFPQQLAVRQGDQTVVSKVDHYADDLYSWGMQKFHYEADSLAKLRHPNIVGVNYLFQANKTAYMVLDFIDGQTMKNWLRELGRPPTQEELYQLLFPLLDALEAVHIAGLMHRDISPKNIMLTRSLTPILIDFGAVRLNLAQHSQTVANVFTPGYAPAEQHSNRSQGAWTDIYSLAATFYNSVAGFTPPDGLERVVDDACRPLASVARTTYDPRFVELIEWGLRPHPKDRPQTIAAWRSEFLLIDRSGPKTSGAPAGSWFSRLLKR